jgi:hypothetical protein
MGGKQLGWRLPRLLVEEFSGLCSSVGLRPSEVVGEFMRRAVTVDDVEEALGMIEPRGEEMLLARRLKAQAIIACLQGSIQDNDFSGEEHDAYRELLQLLPLLHDAELIEDVKRLSVQVNTFLRGGRGAYLANPLRRLE